MATFLREQNINVYIVLPGEPEKNPTFENS